MDDGHGSGKVRSPTAQLLDQLPGWDERALHALVTGILAAPPQWDQSAWMDLVAENPSPKLRAMLIAYKLALTRGLNDGLNGPEQAKSRVAALRHALARQGLNGFIVPKSDEHLSEYVSHRAERLAWLSGFTGSAGMAVVLEDQAAVFSDGRYTLQLEQETDGAVFERRHISDDPPTAWIERNLPGGAKLGYDPWLHTASQALRFRRVIEKAGGQLVAVDSNPIDAVWDNQPPAPLGPVVLHPVTFSGRSSAEKRQDIAAKLRRDGLAAAVISAPDSICWLLNIRGADVPFTPFALGFAILYADGTVDLFMDARKLTAPVKALNGLDFRLAEPSDFAAALDRLSGRVVRVDGDGSPAWISDRLNAAGAQVDRGGDPCQLPKAVKNDCEAQGIRNAHRRDGVALTRFLAWLDMEAAGGGVDEMAAADRLEAFRAEGDHFRGLSFPTIAGAGANGAIVHYRVTSKTNAPLLPDHLFLVDSGGQYLDGTTDVTRTVVIGKPSDEMRMRYTQVLKGHVAVATARFPQGTQGGHLDALARRPLWDGGVDYDHGTGHGVGSFLSVHEGPQRISKAGGGVPLEAGMVLSNEPGYYKPGAYGLRIENLIAVIRQPKP
ncbi:MAG: M24B family metallopeptidase, partial [Rhodospirillales bacterium]